MSNGDYILARMDVVAFSALFESTTMADSVFDAFERISSDSNERIRRLNASTGEDSKLEAKHYGDTIDIFFKSGGRDQSMILMLIDVVAKAQREALNYGFFVKGAIVKGNLRFNDEGYTGCAMIAAHKMEQSCLYPCISFSKEIMELINETAQGRFRTDAEITDFKTNIIVDGLFLNYLEACPFEFWKERSPNLRAHRKSLLHTIERYVCLPNDPAKHEEHVKMYEYALENHNRICDDCGAPEEKIKFRVEQIDGVGKLIFDE